MRFAKPYNPKTGRPAIGTCETIPGVALIVFNRDGSADYAGETKVNWNEQRPITDRKGRVRLIDRDGRTWLSRMIEDSS